MNKNIRLLATILPVLLVPLFNNRKEIKDHPDLKKLSKNSQIVYGKVKDKTLDAAEYGKKATESLGSIQEFFVDKYHDQKTKHNYEKQMKDYEKQQKELAKIEAKFESEKEKHKHTRVNSKNELKTLTSNEKERRMSVSKGSQKLNIETPETKNIRELNDQKVLGTEYEDNYESGSLHMKHKDLLDPKSARLRKEKHERAAVRKAARDNSLFGKHRRSNERHINSIGRKTGSNDVYQKSESHRDFLEWKEKHND